MEQGGLFEDHEEEDNFFSSPMLQLIQNQICVPARTVDIIHRYFTFHRVAVNQHIPDTNQTFFECLTDRYISDMSQGNVARCLRKYA
jgi:hypothetical protein